MAPVPGTVELLLCTVDGATAPSSVKRGVICPAPDKEANLFLKTQKKTVTSFDTSYEFQIVLIFYYYFLLLVVSRFIFLHTVYES